MLVITPSANERFRETGELPESFLTSLPSRTLAKVAAAAQQEASQVAALILSGAYGEGSDEARWLRWFHKRLYSLSRHAEAIAEGRAEGVAVFDDRQPEPDNTYTFLNSLSNERLAQVKAVLIKEGEPLRKRWQEEGADSLSNLEQRHFVNITIHFQMVSDIFLKRKKYLLHLANCVREDGSLAYDSSLLISE